MKDNVIHLLDIEEDGVQRFDLIRGVLSQIDKLRSNISQTFGVICAMESQTHLLPPLEETILLKSTWKMPSETPGTMEDQALVIY